MADRTKSIGGSDAPAILGLSEWKSPYQVYLEKRGELIEAKKGGEEPPHLFWGKQLEPVIRQRYADVTGRRVVVLKEPIIHPKIEWMTGSLDGIADSSRVLEIKTSRTAENWGEPGTDEIPEAYMAQVQHYLAITGFRIADVAALIGGNDFRLYEIHADVELQLLIINTESRFWEMVQAGTPPPTTSYADLVRRFGSMSRAITVQASAEAIAAVGWLKELKAIIAEEESLKAVVMGTLGEADTLLDGEKVLCTWKAARASQRFDLSGFKEEHPELYQQFLKLGEPSRRLLIK